MRGQSSHRQAHRAPAVRCSSRSRPKRQAQRLKHQRVGPGLPAAVLKPGRRLRARALELRRQEQPLDGAPVGDKGKASARTAPWASETAQRKVQSGQFSRSVVSVLCDPMDCRMPGLPVHHQLPEFTQTHVHPVGDAVQPSHLLPSPASAFNLSEHQGLSQWARSSHQGAKVLRFQLQHQSFQWIFRTDLLLDGLVGSPCSPRDSQEFSSAPQFKSMKTLLPRLYFYFPRIVNGDKSLFHLLSHSSFWRGSEEWGSSSETLSYWVWASSCPRVEKQDFSQPVLNVGDVTRPQGWRFMPLSDHHLSKVLVTKDARQFKIHGQNISKRKVVMCPCFPKNEVI